MGNINFEQNSKSFSAGKMATYILGGLVYAGVIVVATVLTSMFVTGILPENAYGLRVLITLGVIAVGLNAVALPIGLHFWAVDGLHRGLAIVFYAVDMVIIGLNLITAFSALSGRPPAWVEQYEPYSVGMLVFALASWGVLKIVDPGEKANLDLLKAQQTFRVRAIEQAAAFLESAEGRATIAAAAENLIPEMFNPETMNDKPRSWYGNNGTQPQNRPQNVPMARLNSDTIGTLGEVPQPVPFGKNGKAKN